MAQTTIASSFTRHAWSRARADSICQDPRAIPAPQGRIRAAALDTRRPRAFSAQRADMTRARGRAAASVRVARLRQLGPTIRMTATRLSARAGSTWEAAPATPVVRVDINPMPRIRMNPAYSAPQTRSVEAIE